jgi:hypothetical protein
MTSVDIDPSKSVRGSFRAGPDLPMLPTCPEYSKHRPGEPTTQAPSVVTSLWIRFDRVAGVISGSS